MKINKLIIYCLLLLSFVACEDVVDVDLENAAPQLVVDAWINNQPGPQRIILTQSQAYFNSDLPPAVSGATVEVTDNLGETFVFSELPQEPGVYIWEPTANETFGTVGNDYALSITTNGETYQAFSSMHPVPEVDSITFELEDDNPLYPEGSYLAEFWARDIEGSGNTYWIRTYKNGAMLNKPEDINIAYDAGFSAGGNFDGVIFIVPIRQGINPVDEDEDDEVLPPYVKGDSVFVEIQAITNEAFDYLNEVQIQTDRPGGFAELFANPLANVSTNIENVNADGPKALGFFNIGAVSGLGKRCNECE